MIIHKGYKNLNLVTPVVTLGVFDGVHRGHHTLLNKLVERARETNSDSVVITFSPHPRLVLEPLRKDLYFLTTMEERMILLEKANISHLIIIEFTKTLLSALPAESKVIRVGGTEFLVIVSKVNNNIESLANNVFRTLQEKKYLIENEVISVTVSMSAMSIPLKTASIQNIQRLLDEKLLEVKSKGKNNVAILGIKHLDSCSFYFSDCLFYIYKVLIIAKLF